MPFVTHDRSIRDIIAINLVYRLAAIELAGHSRECQFRRERLRDFVPRPIFLASVLRCAA